MSTRRDKPTPAPSYGPDLTDLIATERRLEQALADARAEADGLVAAARATAAVHDGNHAAALRIRRAEIDAEVDARAAHRLAAMQTLAREQLARLEALDGGALEQLARRVAQRLVSALLRGEPP